MNGIEATRQMRPISPASQVLVLTSFAEDRHVRDAIQAGAVGYLLKDVLKPELVRAIVDAARGRPTLHPEAQRHLIRQISEPETPSSAINLTQREISVLRLIAQGYSNKQIAAELHLTEGTVKGYVSTILGKLGVADRTQAALYAVKNGLASG
jgi:DNA-binding NarL/FixJ family response regulator